MPRRKKGTLSSDCKGGLLLNHKGKPQQRNAANARERARMRVLSRAFSKLKTTLPWVPPDTKLSKLDTLRLAASYIAQLKKELSSDSDSTNGKDELSTKEINLAWPFGFNSRPGMNPLPVTAASHGPTSGGGSEGGDDFFLEDDEEEEGGWGDEENVSMNSRREDCIHLESQHPHSSSPSCHPEHFPNINTSSSSYYRQNIPHSQPSHHHHQQYFHGVNNDTNVIMSIS